MFSGILFQLDTIQRTKTKQKKPISFSLGKYSLFKKTFQTHRTNIWRVCFLDSCQNRMRWALRSPSPSLKFLKGNFKCFTGGGGVGAAIHAHTNNTLFYFASQIDLLIHIAGWRGISSAVVNCPEYRSRTLQNMSWCYIKTIQCRFTCRQNEKWSDYVLLKFYATYTFSENTLMHNDGIFGSFVIRQISKNCV